MAITTINLSDPISTLVSKTNTISNDIGDRSALTTPVGSSLVAAINEINTRLEAVDTPSELATQVEAEFASTVFTAGGFSADSANIDSATINNLASDNIFTNSIQFAADSAIPPVLAFLKPLKILDANGDVVKAGYLISTSSIDSTL